MLTLLATACGDEAPEGATLAEPRPSPTATASLPDRPVVDTAGSPPPPFRLAPAATVTVTATGIDVPPLLPRVQTAVRVLNKTSSAHQIELRGSRGGSVVVNVAGNAHAIIQAPLVDEEYELVCRIEGHSERATFRTYVPGTSLQ